MAIKWPQEELWKELCQVSSCKTERATNGKGASSNGLHTIGLPDTN